MSNPNKYQLKFILVILLFALYGHSTNAQQAKINELSERLKRYKKEDTTKANMLCELAFYYHTIQPDSTESLALRALELSNKLNYLKGRANSFKHLAIVSYIRADNLHAIKFNDKALKIYRDLGDIKGEGSVLNNIANIYHNEGKLDLALSFFKRSLQIRRDLNDYKGIGDSYNNIGNIYTDKGNYTKALENLYESLRIRESNNDTEAIANSYSNIAGVYYYMKKLDEAFANAKKAYDLHTLVGDKEGMIQSTIALGGVCSERKDYHKALFYFNKALKIARELRNINGIAVGLTNIGEVNNCLHKPDSAISRFNEALKICKQFEDIPGMGICELGIGKALLSKNQTKEAIKHLEKGYAFVSQVHNKFYEHEGARTLAEAYEKDHNTEKTIAYLKKYIIYKDSLFNEETNRKSQEIEFNYLLQKKQNEISLLEKDHSIQKTKSDFQFLLTVGLSALVGLLILFVYFINTFRVKESKAKDLILKQKNEIEEQAKNLEGLNIYKDKIFSILSHDLRSPISTLTHIVELLDQEVLTEEDFANVRLRFISQLKSINLLLDNTLNWAKSQMSGELLPVKENVNLSQLVQRNFELFQQNANEKNIGLLKEFEQDLKVWIDPYHLDIILRNIISNAVKFTHPKGQIWVRAFEEKGQIKIQISDNGQGMNQETLKQLFTYTKQQGNYGTGGERGAGIGMLLTKDFVERNQGSIEVKSKENEGTVFTISFPVHA